MGLLDEDGCTVDETDDDEDDSAPDLDPRNMLPFSCQMEPEDPAVQRLPYAHVGTDRAITGGPGVNIL